LWRRASPLFDVQLRFPKQAHQEDRVIPRLRYFVVALLLAVLAAPNTHAQDKSADKSKDPKIVFDLEKPAPSDHAADAASGNGSTHLSTVQPFGKACSSVGAAKDGYRTMDRAYSITELFGAPIALVTIRRLDEKSDREEVRKHIIAVLNAQTVEVSRYADWDEAVPLGIVATVQFFDRTKGVIEESGGHVCFSDYSGTVWWLRIPTTSTSVPPVAYLGRSCFNRYNKGRALCWNSKCARLAIHSASSSPKKRSAAAQAVLSLAAGTLDESRFAACLRANVRRR
jgi:hypothetical protein